MSPQMSRSVAAIFIIICTILNTYNNNKQNANTLYKYRIRVSRLFNHICMYTYVYVIVVNTASLAGQRHRLSVSRMAHS